MYALATAEIALLCLTILIQPPQEDIIPAPPEGIHSVSGHVAIDLSNTAATDEDLAVVVRAPDLDELNLAFTKVTDAGLDHLRRAPKLATLNLSSTKVTDAAIPKLQRLADLYRVDIGQTEI